MFWCWQWDKPPLGLVRGRGRPEEFRGRKRAFGVGLNNMAGRFYGREARFRPCLHCGRIWLLQLVFWCSLAVSSFTGAALVGLASWTPGAVFNPAAVSVRVCVPAGLVFICFYMFFICFYMFLYVFYMFLYVVYMFLYCFYMFGLLGLR